MRRIVGSLLTVDDSLSEGEEPTGGERAGEGKVQEGDCENEVFGREEQNDENNSDCENKKVINRSVKV